jgi:hypothetical protein
MIKGIVKIDNDLVKGVTIYESNEMGLPLLKNNRYLSTLTNEKGEYSINLPKSDNFFITFKFTGTNGATLSTKKVPLTLILPTTNILDEQEVTTTKFKKFNYWWLLLLLPIVYKLSKKR